jgi:hypothetical protein
VPNNQNKKETLYLLKDVTGYFRPQEMAALVRRAAADVLCTSTAAETSANISCFACST